MHYTLCSSVSHLYITCTLQPQCAVSMSQTWTLHPHLCVTCASLVYHMCITCVSPVFHLCLTCISPVYLKARPLRPQCAVSMSQIWTSHPHLSTLVAREKARAKAVDHIQRKYSMPVTLCEIHHLQSSDGSLGYHLVVQGPYSLTFLFLEFS